MRGFIWVLILSFVALLLLQTVAGGYDFGSYIAGFIVGCVALQLGRRRR